MIFYTTIAGILMYIIYNKKIILDLYSLYKVVFVPNDCMVQYFCIFTVFSCLFNKLDNAN